MSWDGAKPMGFRTPSKGEKVPHGKFRKGGGKVGEPKPSPPQRIKKTTAHALQGVKTNKPIHG